MKLPKAILIDLDDTILALSETADPSWRKVCERFSPQLEAVAEDEMFDAIKRSRTSFWSDPQRQRKGRLDLLWARREIVGSALSGVGSEDAVLTDRIVRSYVAVRDEALRPLPGAIEALQAFRDSGVRLALLTNAEAGEQRRKIERFGLASYFDCIIIEGEFGAGKPDERVYKHALQELGVEPADAWMVGDNLEWDVAGAQRVGIRGIWIDPTGDGAPDGAPHPDSVVRALSDLAEGTG